MDLEQASKPYWIYQSIILRAKVNKKNKEYNIWSSSNDAKDNSKKEDFNGKI